MATGDVIRRLSLQARLLTLLALLLAILWAGLEITTRGAATTRADTELQRELRETTDLLAAVFGPGSLDAEARRAVFDVAQARGPAFLGAPVYELLGREGVILRSDPFPDFSAPPPPGLSRARDGSQTWHVLTVIDQGTGQTRRAALSDTALRQRTADLRVDLSVIWTIALPVFAIATLATIWIGLRPLRRIEKRMAALSPRDPEPLGLDTCRMPRELATLALTFDQLAERLARAMTDQRIFASAASHELRTPLAGALSQLDVLRRAPDRHESYDRLAEALSHMNRLVSQLLSLARCDTLTASDRPEPVDLADLAREAGAELQIGPTLRITGEGEIQGYRDLLRSLLRNLLRNAHTASDGAPITVGITPQGDTVSLAVSDRGPGIPVSERSRVILPFQRGSDGAPGPGSGLGLAVAQRVAERHGGRLEITGAPGHGATVSAILARVPPDDAPNESSDPARRPDTRDDGPT